MLTAKELADNLRRCCGSAQLYYHPLYKNFRYTDGVRFLAQNAEAYWLLERIFQLVEKHRLDQKPDLCYFQVWLLVVGSDHSFIKPKADHTAVLTCWPDTPTENEPPAARFDIRSTDFPLKEFKMYREHGILLLPSER